jgi:hypothetical protein
MEALGLGASFGRIPRFDLLSCALSCRRIRGTGLYHYAGVSSLENWGLVSGWGNSGYSRKGVSSSFQVVSSSCRKWLGCRWLWIVNPKRVISTHRTRFDGGPRQLAASRGLRRPPGGVGEIPLSVRAAKRTASIHVRVIRFGRVPSLEDSDGHWDHGAG